jgi:hypothetical protein
MKFNINISHVLCAYGSGRITVDEYLELLKLQQTLTGTDGLIEYNTKNALFNQFWNIYCKVEGNTN